MSEEKKIMATREAFQYFVDEFYKTITNKSEVLRAVVYRYRKGETVTEQAMEKILKNYFKETEIMQPVKGWDVN